MRASTYICTNIEEIERVREENDKLNLPNPQPLPKPKYMESTGWFHVDDITRGIRQGYRQRISSVFNVLRWNVHGYQDDL
jgi:hypothetical protein